MSHTRLALSLASGRLTTLKSPQDGGPFSLRASPAARRAGCGGLFARGDRELVQGTAKELLIALARNPHLEERNLLRLLERGVLPQEVVRKLANHPEAQRNYTVRFLPRCGIPRPRVWSPCLSSSSLLVRPGAGDADPPVPTDLKIIAEETILKKLEGVPRGEKISLARRGTGRLAASLLVSGDPELTRAALENPYLTEGHLLKALTHENLPPVVVELLAQHERWSLRYHLRLALIRNPLTPLARVLAFLPELAVTDLREICLE